MQRPIESRKELYELTWKAMDACNSSGLLYSMPYIVAAISKYEGKIGSQINNHPIIVMFADKLMQLALNGSIYERDSFISDAYSEVRLVMESEQKK